MTDGERIVENLNGTPDLSTKLLALLGLALRAGQLAVGGSAVVSLVQRGKRPLIVVARDCGGSRRRKMLAQDPVRGFILDAVDREQLSQALGRGDLAVVAVSERGFVRGIEKLGIPVSPPSVAD